MRLLVVAVSARMLAELAAAAGHEVIACDRFGDADLRAIAAVRTASSNEALVRAADRVEAEGVVYGAGLENRADLVARLARGRELLGTPPAALPAVRVPLALHAALSDAGLASPHLLGPGHAARAGQDGWLVKPLHGGGGRGIRRWVGGRVGPGEFLQREVAGLSCSGTAIAGRGGAVLLGITEQLHRGRYGWAGNRVLSAPPRELTAQLTAACKLAAARGVRGAFGVDAIWDGERAWVVEVNPRPTASLELFGRGGFAAHIAGVRDGRIEPETGNALRVKRVVFADCDLRAPDPAWWRARLAAVAPLVVARDLPPRGTRVGRGEPVCTLLSGDPDPGTPRRLARLGAELLAGLAVGAADG